jgi:hypothetical protein
MEMAVQIYDSHSEMKADEYRYWQSRPAYERMDAVSTITLSLHAMKEPTADVPRLQRTISVLPRPRS